MKHDIFFNVSKCGRFRERSQHSMQERMDNVVIALYTRLPHEIKLFCRHENSQRQYFKNLYDVTLRNFTWNALGLCIRAQYKVSIEPKRVFYVR